MWALGGALVIYSLILFLRNYRCMHITIDIYKCFKSNVTENGAVLPLYYIDVYHLEHT